MCRKLHEEEIKLAVVDQIVAFIVQIAVDVGEQTTDLLHGQHFFQHIDVDDPAELIHIVPLMLRCWQKPPLDPVLNGIGLQPGDGRNLAQHDPTAEEHGGKLLLNKFGILPLNGKGCTR